MLTKKLRGVCLAAFCILESTIKLNLNESYEVKFRKSEILITELFRAKCRKKLGLNKLINILLIALWSCDQDRSLARE